MFRGKLTHVWGLSSRMFGGKVLRKRRASAAFRAPPIYTCIPLVILYDATARLWITLLRCNISKILQVKKKKHNVSIKYLQRATCHVTVRCDTPFYPSWLEAVSSTERQEPDASRPDTQDSDDPGAPGSHYRTAGNGCTRLALASAHRRLEGLLECPRCRAITGLSSVWRTVMCTT